MTEDEARKKWCPHTWKVTPYGTSEINKGKCIASDCMMWRNEKDIGRTHDPVPGRGYCGLAGKP